MNHRLQFFEILIFFCMHTAFSATLSLSLSDAVSQAIAHVPELKIADLGMQKAHAQSHTLQASYMPTIYGDATYAHIYPVPQVSLGAGSMDMAPANFYDAHVSADWLVYDFGKRAVDEQKSSVGELIAKEHRNALRITIEYKTILAYLGLVYDDEAIREQDTLLENLKQHLANTTKRIQSGSAIGFDTLKTVVRMANGQSQRLTLLNDRSHRVIQLRQLLGLTTTDSLQTTDTTLALDIPSRNLDSLTALALQTRAEMKLLGAMEKSAQLAVETFDKANSPALVASISAGVKDGYPTTHGTEISMQDPVLNGTVGLEFHMPIWDGGRQQGKGAEAKLALLMVQDSLNSMTERIAQEVQSALADLQAAYEQSKLSDVTVVQTQEAVRIAQTQYASGTTTNQDYLDAVADLSQTRLQQYQHHYRYTLGAVALREALGLNIVAGN